MQYTGATHERTIRHHVTLYMGPTPPWVALLFPRNHKAISFCSNLTRTSTGVSGYCCAPKGWLLKFNLEAMLCLVALIRQQRLWHLTLQTSAASSNFISSLSWGHFIPLLNARAAQLAELSTTAGYPWKLLMSAYLQNFATKMPYSPIFATKMPYSPIFATKMPFSHIIDMWHFRYVSAWTWHDFFSWRWK